MENPPDLPVRATAHQMLLIHSIYLKHNGPRARSDNQSHAEELNDKS